MTRLRTVFPAKAGWTRRRVGRGFAYADTEGRPLEADDVARCRALVIPPAWQQVWICPYPNGHIQAVGTDERGRRQYIYHEEWRLRRARAKHDRVLAVAQRLPQARRSVRAALALPGMPEERALATAFCLLDLGYFRIGSDTYATENGSYGLTTLERRHVRQAAGRLVFEFTAKSGVAQHIEIVEPAVLASVERMRRRRDRSERLLAYQSGRSWRHVSAEQVNEYLKDLLGDEMSAKDFRTWHGTVFAAAALAEACLAGGGSGGASKAMTATAQKRAVSAAMRAVAEHLGNTPAVAPSSYVDARVIDLINHAQTIADDLTRLDKRPPTDPARQRRLERAVLELLGRETGRETSRVKRR